MKPVRRICVARGLSKRASVVKSVCKALGQRRQTLHALLPVEERGCSGEEQVQPREPAAVDLVHELAKRVQRLLADVASHALQRLDFVEDDDESGVVRIAKDGEQPLEEAECAEVVEVAPNSGGTLHGGRYVRLATEPRQQSIRLRRVTRRLRQPVLPQHSGEGRRLLRDIRQSTLEEVERSVLSLLIVRLHPWRRVRGCRTSRQ